VELDILAPLDTLAAAALFGQIRLISIVGLSGFGLVSLSGINDLIVRIGLVSLVGLSGFGLISLVNISGFGLVGLVGFIGFGLISLVGLSGFGLVGLSGINGISLICLGRHNDDISLIGLGFVFSACWLINFIGLGIKSLIGKNGFIGLCLIGFIGLGLGSLINGISLIGLLGLIGFIRLVDLVRFCLNGLTGKGIVVNSRQFEIEMKPPQHELFWRESGL
jgi:hypothetical protein